MPIEIELTGDSSDLLKDLRNIADEMEVINDGTQEIEKSYKETFSKSAKEVDKTTKSIVAQVKATDKLDKDVDGLKKSYTSLEKSKKEAFDDKEVVDLNKELDKTDKKVDEIKKSTDGGLLGGLSEGIGELKEGFGGITEELLPSGGGGIGGGLTSMLGKLGPIGVGVGAVVGGLVAVGSEMIAINGEFDTLRGKIELLTGATGFELDSIAVSLKGISGTFDVEVEESLQAVNVLMKEFGISGQEATELLEKGFLSNANIQGDLIDGVKEYSSQIRASGGSADDLFSILDKSGQEGIFSDKGIDVVKEFGLRIREQTTATSEAMENAFGKPFADRIANGVSDGSLSSIEALKLVSEELGTLDESSKEAQTVLADVFGGAGEDAGFRFLTQLKDINTEQGFQVDTTNSLVQAQQKNLDAQKDLADVQNRLSKAIGDTSAVGRIWTQIQTEFWELVLRGIGYIKRLVEGFELLSTDPVAGMIILADAIQELMLYPLNQVIDLANAVTEAFGFEGIIPNIDLIADSTENLTKAQKEYNLTLAIGNSLIPESSKLINEQSDAINGQLDALRDSNTTNEERSVILEDINAKYPELLDNIDIENITTKELNAIKQELRKTIIQEEIARQKNIATKLLENEIDKKTIQLANAKSQSVKDNIQKEIDAIRDIGTKRINVLEQEFSDRLGLTDILNSEELKKQQEQDKKIENSRKSSSDNRKKIESDFNKSIQELLKRGETARLNDLTLSEEERLTRKNEFNQSELKALFDHVKEQNKILNGGKELDIEVVQAFNDAQEKLENDFKDKLLEIKRKKIAEEKKLVLENRKSLLGIDKESFEIRKSFLESQQNEELAIIEQAIREEGESERQFEIRKQQDILDTKQFYLDRKAELIDQETQLKLDAIDIELLAIADKEGLEYDLKRKNLEQKKELIEQETSEQKEEYKVQKDYFQQQINDLAGTDKKTFEDSLNNIKESIAKSLNIDTEQLSQITDAVVEVGKQVFDTIRNSVNEQLSANEEVLQTLAERTDTLESQLDRELKLNEQGFASNVQAKLDEIEEIKKIEQLALLEKSELLKKQKRLDDIAQLSSLVTSSANIFSSLSGIPFVGVPLAIGLIATMFGAFISSKQQAKNLTKLEKGGSGDNTGMFIGNRHNAGGEQFLEHVEVEDGEKWGVLNRSASNEYGIKFDDMVKSMNSGTFDDFGSDIVINKEIPEIIIEKRNLLSVNNSEMQSEMIADKMNIDLKKLHSIDKILKKQYNKTGINIYTNKKGDVIREVTLPNGGKQKFIINE